MTGESVTMRDRQRTPIPFSGYVRAFAVAGVVAGVAVAAFEAFDRVVVLRHQLGGGGRAVDFAVLCALTAPFVMAVAAVGGLVIGSIAACFRSLRRTFTGEAAAPTRRASLLAGAATAVAIVVVAAVAGAPFWSVVAERFAYYAHLRKQLDWIVLAQILPFLLAIPLALSVPTVDRLLTGRVRRWWRVAACAGLLLVAFVAYWIDSRALVDLSDDSMHFGLGLAAIGSATAASLVLIAPVWRNRSVAIAAVVCGALALACAAVGATRLGADPVVQALFWTRGVLAVRPALLIQRLADRDGDGFPARFGGGDPDDGDPARNILAREIPGDGIDQNGIGGDPADWHEPDPTDAATFGAVAPPPGPGRRNVLFIAIDTLRADHLSCYGYRRPTSPNIDSFAAGGALFETAESQGTSTGHSFASMMTGAYGDDILDPAQPRLGAVLSAHGYEAIPTNPSTFHNFINRDQYWLYYRDIMTSGFSPYGGKPGRERKANDIVDDTIAYLTNAPKDKPLFTWVLLRDPHASYIRHPEFDFGRRVIDRYDSEIAFTDYHLGRLFDYLKASGTLDDTLVIITSDHGESFGEHGDYAHHRRPYRTLANVPLIVRWPGSPAVRVPSAAGPLDIAITICNWTGIEDPAVLSRLDGLDLRWQAEQPPGSLASRAIVTETPRNCPEPNFLAWSITQGNSRLIYDAIGSRVELFDVASDPLEQRNLAADRPDEAARLTALLGRWLDRMSMRSNYSGWAQMQPSMWSPAPRFPALPPRDGDTRDADDDGGDGLE